MQELNGKIFGELVPGGELDYTFDLTSWCAKSGVDLTNTFTVEPIVGATVVLVNSSRNQNKILITVRGTTVGGMDECGEFTDGVTLNFTTTVGATGVPLKDSRTMYFITRERKN